MLERMIPISMELVTGFTAVFSRYEYALKNSGFAKGSKSKAEPDWDAFALSIADKFDHLTNPRFREAVTYLVTSPPRKQVLVDHRVRWKESPPDVGLRASAQALLMVRRVRNNLFHGAKIWAPDGDWSRERNEKLVKDSLVVLVACLPLHPHVGGTFGYFDFQEYVDRLAA